MSASAEPKTTSFHCPLCGSPTYITQTTSHQGRTEVRRTRKCRRFPNTHSIETVEQARLSLDHVLIRRSRTGRLGAKFDRVQLEADIAAGVLKRMTDDEIRALTDSVVSDLNAHLSILAQPIPVEYQKQGSPGYTHTIMDSDIREAVEARLRKGPDRMRHVLYALSTLGRTDQKGREGFSNAQSVLDWLFESPNYSDLHLDFPREKPALAIERWWSPSEPPLPSHVLKRDGGRRDFRLGQFTESIAKAMRGRPAVDQVSQQVARWVLWGLTGQKQVLSAQLASGALECLRRVDDIAYLRWAAVAKRMDSVGTFRGEALGLILYPSPRLQFDSDAVEMIRPSPRGPR